ncbi:MAG: hypothetical protein QM627_03360 [Luteolibacter sp.]
MARPLRHRHLDRLRTALDSHPSLHLMKRLLLLAPLLFAACSPAPPPVPRDAAGNELSEPFVRVSGQPTPTDTARFLAGRPVRNGAGLSNFQQSANYQTYSRGMLQKWKYRAARRLDRQDAWQSQHIVPLIGTPRTLLYPFGGPDLMHAISMFPASTHYILLGLEPAGQLPDLENTDAGLVAAALPRNAKSVETQLLHGYFITKDMRNDLNNGPLQGVTPILLTSLGLMHATVTDVRSISAGGNPSIQIDFILPDRGRKTVTYVSGDISNGRFGSLQSWLSSNASGSVAYFKAASYLMHDGNFSSVRNWVLGNCRATVQDDSGIPYRAYDPAKWNIHLFGNYQAPIELFTKHTQADLRAAYAAAGPLPSLTFGSGYELKPERANLMISIRK